jgi:hypothetical protein
MFDLLNAKTNSLRELMRNTRLLVVHLGLRVRFALEISEKSAMPSTLLLSLSLSGDESGAVFTRFRRCLGTRSNQSTGCVGGSSRCTQLELLLLKHGGADRATERASSIRVAPSRSSAQYVGCRMNASGLMTAWTGRGARSAAADP